MRTGIATVSLSGLLADKLAAVAEAGFDGVEIFDADLVASPMAPREVARRCAGLGLTVDLLQPLRDVEGVPPWRFDAVVHRVRRKLDVAAELGATAVLACSNVDPAGVDDVDLSAEQLCAVGDLAAERGIAVAFEALAWGRHAYRVQHAWERVRRASHPAVGLAVDTFHLLARGDDASALDGMGRIAFLQVADAPRLDTNVLDWSRHHRCFPGQGALDVLPVVARVLELGYRGPVSLEVFSDVVREADPRETAVDALRSLRLVEDALHRRALVDAPPGGPLAPAPDRADVAFVELAEGPSTPALLEGLGFRRAGEHRTKPVTWWRHGDAHVVTNRSGLRGGRATGIGLVADPVTDVAARAAALDWPLATHTRSRDEARLPGVVSPSGVQVWVSASQGPDFWQGDFSPEGPADPAGPGWLGVDHVGTVVDEPHLPAETSFHRGLLGLVPGPVTEFIEPHGRMLSRVLRPTRGSLRLVLTVEETSPGHPVGVNQLAFACRDVRAEVRRLRERRVPLLDVPDNYYADLDARFDLDAALLAELRELGLCYDRVGDGELLHAYTPMLEGGCYVELLERRGGYDGFGAANTALRLALQA